MSKKIVKKEEADLRQQSENYYLQLKIFRGACLQIYCSKEYLFKNYSLAVSPYIAIILALWYNKNSDKKYQR